MQHPYRHVAAAVRSMFCIAHRNYVAVHQRHRQRRCILDLLRATDQKGCALNLTSGEHVLLALRCRTDSRSPKSSFRKCSLAMSSLMKTTSSVVSTQREVGLAQRRQQSGIESDRCHHMMALAVACSMIHEWSGAESIHLQLLFRVCGCSDLASAPFQRRNRN